MLAGLVWTLSVSPPPSPINYILIEIGCGCLVSGCLVILIFTSCEWCSSSPRFARKNDHLDVAASNAEVYSIPPLSPVRPPLDSDERLCLQTSLRSNYGSLGQSPSSLTLPSSSAFPRSSRGGFGSKTSDEYGRHLLVSDPILSKHESDSVSPPHSTASPKEKRHRVRIDVEDNIVKSPQHQRGSSVN